VLATGQRAVIGSLDHIEAMLAGNAGTQVCLASAGSANTL
jgi:carbamate kinase